MIVQVIDQFNILAVKPKNDSPVSVNGDREESFFVSTQCMKPPARRVHVIRLFCIVQRSEQNSQLRSMMGLDSRLGPAAEKCLKSLVLEALDHDEDCKASRYTLQPMQGQTTLDAAGGRLIAILPPTGREARYSARRRGEAFSDDAKWSLDERRPEIQCGPQKLLRTNPADCYF